MYALKIACFTLKRSLKTFTSAGLEDFLCTRPTASQLTSGQLPCIWGCHSDSTRDSETLRTAFLSFGFLQLVVVSLFDFGFAFLHRSSPHWCYKVVHKPDNPHLSSLSKKDRQGENGGCRKDDPMPHSLFELGNL